MSSHRATTGCPRWVTWLRFLANTVLFGVVVLLGFCVWLNDQPVIVYWVR
jgi:hypothetical protein